MEIFSGFSSLITVHSNLLQWRRMDLFIVEIRGEMVGGGGNGQKFDNFFIGIWIKTQRRRLCNGNLKGVVWFRSKDTWGAGLKHLADSSTFSYGSEDKGQKRRGSRQLGSSLGCWITGLGRVLGFWSVLCEYEEIFMWFGRVLLYWCIVDRSDWSQMGWGRETKNLVRFAVDRMAKWIANIANKFKKLTKLS